MSWTPSGSESDEPMHQDFRETRALFDEVAGEYDRTGVAFFGPVGGRLVQHAALRRGEAVLDIGCGRGAVLIPAARAVGPQGRATGIDISAAMVEAARAEAHAAGLDTVEVRIGDGQDPRFPPGAFDAVTGGMSVHMLTDPPAAFRAYGRLLRPGGRLALSAPTCVHRPEPEVFGLRSIARMAAAHPSGSGVYPYAEPFGGARRARADLLDAGFTEVEIHDEPAFITADSARQFLRWTRTHGMRRLWQRIPPPLRPGLERAITTEAQARSEAPGHIALRVPVTYVVAHAPPARTDAADASAIDVPEEP
ncbi:class I SAM-dependent methyltransferase [Streptomyces sp. NPDC101151]|uniref:class I SAM-dependent methyltransferase n=1 Tax=Streptomyces sp. NPDC101151 TaxID=3366115 RepID=UPI0037FD56D7